jgi:hypothetical protein
MQGGADSAVGQVPVHEHLSPAELADRRELKNYEGRKAPTDFEPWAQAENALATGSCVEDVVRREFTRDFGPHAVQCARFSSCCSVHPFPVCLGEAAGVARFMPAAMLCSYQWMSPLPLPSQSPALLAPV